MGIIYSFEKLLWWERPFNYYNRINYFLDLNWFGLIRNSFVRISINNLISKNTSLYYDLICSIESCGLVVLIRAVLNPDYAGRCDFWILFNLGIRLKCYFGVSEYLNCGSITSVTSLVDLFEFGSYIFGT